MTATPQAIERAYRRGHHAIGRAMTVSIGVSRGGTPQSGGAVTNSARRDAAGGRIALGDGRAMAKSLEGAANREVPEPGAVGRRAARRLPAINDRFWAKVDKSVDCWLWVGTTDKRGYGHFWVGDRLAIAHRVAYELAVGPISTGLTVDHLCHNADPSCPGGPACAHRRCVNPAHLEPVTSAENTRRGKSARLTHCQHGHAYTPENSYRHPDGDRVCRMCRRAWDRARYWRRQGERALRDSAANHADPLGFASRQSLSSRDSSATGDLGPDGSAN